MLNEKVEANLAVAAINQTMLRDRHPAVVGMGLRTQQFRQGNLSSPLLPRTAEEFIIASRIRRWDGENLLSISSYFTDQIAVTTSKADAEEPGEAARIPLPPHTPIRASFSDIAGRRRSVRAFGGDGLSLPDVASILRHCGSITVEAETDLRGGGSVTIPFRAVPSGGGLYPVEVWIDARRVAGLDRAVYRYLPREDSLARWADEGASQRLRDALVTSESSTDLGDAPLLLLLLARPWRSMRKYGARGMRFTMHEVGGIAQNAHLAAVGLGLGSLDFSSFIDDEANEALCVDGLFHLLLHIIVIGVPK